MNVVDSSAWLEYFADGPNASVFAKAIEDTPGLIVPSITILEVGKRFLQQRGEADALKAIGVMQLGRVVDLNAALALDAAELGFRTGLALADSVIYATAKAFDATLWTQDDDFKDMPGVEYREHGAKRRGRTK
jgi:predicted nucleic acid-binding protein